MPKSELEVIAYHEGLPGHHMQIAIAQELTTIPTFRRQAGFTSDIEGWALYSEWLAREMPALTRIRIRVLADSAPRSGERFDWSSTPACTRKAGRRKRPCSIPCELSDDGAAGALRGAALHGHARPGHELQDRMLKIQELRRKAEAALGDRFDLRAFHDTVLGGGSMPLTMLEQRIDSWVASTSASRPNP